MKVITIAGPKGGTGKSTTCASLAVRSTLETGRVALIDLDAQQTLREWWVLRGKPANPFLFDGEGTLDHLVGALAAEGWTYTFIDGPPHDSDLIEMSVVVADVVLIPLKLSVFDASALESLVEMCQRRGKAYAFVVNEYDKRQIFQGPNNIALAMLDGSGPILKPRISYDPRYRVGLIEGQSGAEIAKPLAKEIDAVWGEVKKLLTDELPEHKSEVRRHG
jgi:chromosome partitioning protein